MKATFAAATAAALVGTTAAGTLHYRHGHEVFHGLLKKNPTNGTETCGCTTIYSTYYGEPTLVMPPPPPAPTTSSSEVAPTTSSSPVPTTYEKTVIVVPTPVPHKPTTTGVVTYPAETVILTEETTVCVPSTTKVPSGTNTIGGVVTVVTTATTVTCPYPTVETSEGVVTSVIKTTEYVCPSEGTYTIAPTTTYVEKEMDVVVPTITSYPPGTYTQPEVVTTVTDTKTVIYCPFEPVEPTTTSVAEPTYSPEPTPEPTTSEKPVPTSYPATSPEPEPTTATPIPTSYPETSEEPIPTYPATSEKPIPTSYPATSPKPEPTTAKPTPSAYPTSNPPKSKPTGELGGDAPGMPWGTTYTPYEPETGLCMSKEEVEKDIEDLASKGIKVVRTYSTDCNTLEYVGDACEKYGIDMMVGVFVDGPGCTAGDSKIAEQITALKNWGKWDMVPLIVVGNEAVINGFCTPQQVAELIETCKHEFNGYTGPYTTAETVNIWQQEDAKAFLCPVVDVIGTNAHAFFNYETSASEAGKFVKSQLDLVSSICGKEGIVLETGWPSEGTTLGKAVPGFAEQAIAIKSIIKECGDKSILFSLYDDKWKSGSTQCGVCEQHWGIKYILDSGL
ncbi:hypothetical protein DL764_010846 [Monosporascus ibericus]|uniref:Probable beta-glucosidase btgE n=1 Tax=Monosporascus ibericus TaxID=155417 RepID=A0A4V1X8K9_9PEZI|nr:hypothetical protein DL764_010846 [Monosporascus ibericus]